MTIDVDAVSARRSSWGLESEPENWRDQALCAQVDPELFFPEKGGSSKAAKTICKLCPVRLECLQDALDHGDRFGVRGGLSERERRSLERPKRVDPPSRLPIDIGSISHGTHAGYNAGCKCRACANAEGWYQRRRHRIRGSGGAA